MGVPGHTREIEDESFGELVRRLEELACDGPIPEPEAKPNVEDLLRLLGDKVPPTAD